MLLNFKAVHFSVRLNVSSYVRWISYLKALAQSKTSTHDSCVKISLNGSLKFYTRGYQNMAH